MKATIKHHSISSARVIEVSDNMTAAKRQATIEFGDEQEDYKICILDDCNEVIASKEVREKKWHI